MTRETTTPSRLPHSCDNLDRPTILLASYAPKLVSLRQVPHADCPEDGEGQVNLVIESEAPVGVDACSPQLREPQSNVEKKEKAW